MKTRAVSAWDSAVAVSRRAARLRSRSRGRNSRIMSHSQGTGPTKRSKV
jgi:hypothetical protein